MLAHVCRGENMQDKLIHILSCKASKHSFLLKGDNTNIHFYMLGRDIDKNRTDKTDCMHVYSMQILFLVCAALATIVF